MEDTFICVLATIAFSAVITECCMCLIWLASDGRYLNPFGPERSPPPTILIWRWLMKGF